MVVISRRRRDREGAVADELDGATPWSCRLVDLEDDVDAAVLSLTIFGVDLARRAPAAAVDVEDALYVGFDARLV